MAINFPTNPSDGEVFSGYYYDEAKTAWRSLPLEQAQSVASSTPPLTANPGEFWFNTNDGVLFTYFDDGTSSQWVEVKANSSLGTTLATRMDLVEQKSINYIINGGMDIWQRGTSFSFSGTSGSYTTDRWAFFTDGTGAAVTVSQQALPAGAISASESGKFFTRINRTTVGAGGTYSNFQQPIEDVRTISSQTVTLSLWAKADAARSISVNLNQDFGTGGSTSVVATAQNGSITTSWARYSFTFALPSIAGKTISATDSKLWVYISTPNVVSTIDIFGVQLEAGSVATPFRRNANSLQGELAACQRYYYRINGGAGFSTLSPSGYATSATGSVFTIPLPVTMRIAPTSIDTLAAAQYIACRWAEVNIALTGISLNTSATTNTLVQLTGTMASGAVAGQSYTLVANNNANAYIGIGAEL